MKSRIAISLLFVLIAAPSFASDATATLAWDPLSALNKTVYGTVTNILLGSAGNVPGKTYNSRTTDAVHSFGLLVGHLADAEYLFCSIALGEKTPAPNIKPATYRRTGTQPTALEMMCLWAGRRSTPKANNNEPLNKPRKGE
jgi:hypothetical protein